MALAKNITFLVNGHNVADALKSFAVSANAEELDASVLAHDYRSFESGYRTATINASGIFDSDTVNEDEIHDILSDAFSTGATNYLSASFGTITVGDPAVMMEGCETSYAIDNVLGQLIMVNASFRATNGLGFGRWLMNAAQAAGANNGTSVDNAAASTGGGIFQVHLFNDDASDVDVKLQHSTDNSVWADVSGGAVNNLSAAHTAGSVDISGTINRYTRAVATVTGGDTFLVSATLTRR